MARLGYMLNGYDDSGDPGKPSTGGGRIPLPDYNNPKSRNNYAELWTKKYGPYMQGRGDTPLRINEVPNIRNERLPVKQSAINAGNKLGIDPALLYASAMEEGLSGTFKKGYEGEGYFNSSADENFPLSGMATMGMDNFYNYFRGPLTKKGYLPGDFANKFRRTVMVNEKGETVESGDFKTAEDAIMAKAALMKNSEDEVSEYAKKNNIELSPKAKQFFTLIHYNAGEGNAKGMMKDYAKAGVLGDDSFLNARPTKGGALKSTSWKVPYDNVMRRIKMADALVNEGHFIRRSMPSSGKTMIRVSK